MLYAFLFSFYFHDDEDDENQNSLEAGFLVSGDALQALAAGVERLTPEALMRHEPHQEWFGECAETLEETYNAVHDVSGTWSDEGLVEGLSTYEIDGKDKALELMREWHAAYAKRVGDAGGLGPLCAVDLKDAEALVPGYSGAADEVAQLFIRLVADQTAKPKAAKP